MGLIRPNDVALARITRALGNAGVEASVEERALLAAYVSSEYFWLTCAANGDGANFEAATRSRFATFGCSALSDADVSDFRARVRGATDTRAALLSRWTRRPESRAPPSFRFRGLRVSDDDDAALQLGT